MKKLETRVLVEIAVAVALAVVLGLIRVYRMPQGGSVSLEMIPLFYVAFRLGARAGIIAGSVYGFVQLVLDPWIAHPAQFLLDYPVAFGLVGVAGYFNNSRLLGVLVGSLGRYVAHVISGVVFFGTYAPEGSSVLGYSMVYNATYLVPEMIISGLVILFLSSRGVFRAGIEG